MAKLQPLDINTLDKAFGLLGGYVLDFTNRTFEEFFWSYKIDIYNDKYAQAGGSKGKRFRVFIKVEDEALVAKVLRKLWEHRETMADYDCVSEAKTKKFLFDIINRMQGGTSMEAIENFTRDDNFDVLIAEIRKGIEDGSPIVMLADFHTYCMRLFDYLLRQKNIKVSRDDPLHSRVGKYVKFLENKHALSTFTKRSLKSSISLFESFNDVRNNSSLAHDNELLGQEEALLVFSMIHANLNFIRSIERNLQGKFSPVPSDILGEL